MTALAFHNATIAQASFEESNGLSVCITLSGHQATLILSLNHATLVGCSPEGESSPIRPPRSVYSVRLCYSGADPLLFKIIFYHLPARLLHNPGWFPGLFFVSYPLYQHLSSIFSVPYDTIRVEDFTTRFWVRGTEASFSFSPVIPQSLRASGMKRVLVHPNLLLNTGHSQVLEAVGHPTMLPELELRFVVGW